MRDPKDIDEGSFVLVAAYRRQQAIAAAPPPEPWMWWSIAERHEQLAHGPCYRPAEWFGLQTPEHIKKRCRRAIDRLEAEGLLVTWRRHGDRLTNVKITPEGAKLAEALIQQHDTPAGQTADAASEL